MTTATVASVVRAEAARRGFKQGDLTRAAGVSRTVGHGRWHGRTPWTAVELVRVCELIGVPPRDILLDAGVVRPASELVAR